MYLSMQSTKYLFIIYIDRIMMYIYKYCPIKVQSNEKKEKN